MAISELSSLRKSIYIFNDLVNEPRRHYTLSHRPKDFSLVCSAIDILDDTLLALSSYLNAPHDDKGLAYLETVGVLQSLVVQQNAVIKLYEITIGHSINLVADYPDTKHIRDVRIRAVGHPVDGKGLSHFLVRHTVSKWSFKLSSGQADGRSYEEINLPALIKANSKALHHAISALINHMKEEDEKHKNTFLEEKLSLLFITNTDFSKKIFESILSRDQTVVITLNLIANVIRKFKISLKTRSPHFEASNHISYNISELEYALNKFEIYIYGDETKNENDAHIVANIIQKRLEYLAEIASDIDKEYEIKKPIEIVN